MEIIDKVELPASVVSLRSDGIIEFALKSNTTLNISDAKSIVDATEKLGGGKKFPLLISAGNFTLVDTEVRYYAASPEANRFTIASGIVVNNLAQKLLGNAYIKFNKPPTPTRLFTKEEEAVKWLKTYLV
jgi:hypothetical protein